MQTNLNIIKLRQEGLGPFTSSSQEMYLAYSTYSGACKKSGFCFASTINHFKCNTLRHIADCKMTRLSSVKQS